MAGADEFYEHLLGKPGLLLRIQVLAHRPDLWVHPTRLQEGSPGGGESDGDGGSLRPTEIQALARSLGQDGLSRRLEERIARLMAEALALPALDYALFAPEPRRLATLSYGLLEALARATGLFRLGPSLAAFVRREEVARIKEQLGAEPYARAIREAPLALGGCRPVPLGPGEIAEGLAETTAAAGWESLGEALADSPDSLLRRVELKLPVGAAAPWRRGVEAGGDPRPSGALLVRVLKNHLNRKAARCIF